MTDDDHGGAIGVDDQDTIATRALAAMPDHEIERQVARCEQLISTHRAGMRDYVLYVHAKRELARRTSSS